MSRPNRAYGVGPDRLTLADQARQQKALNELARLRRHATYWRWTWRTVAALLGIGLATRIFYSF